MIKKLTAEDRKQRPVFTGVLKYFPDAIMEVAFTSFKGSQQHNPDKPLHWDKSKSIGIGDEIIRHLIDDEVFDTDGVRHKAKAAWRALELLQRELESEKNDK
jgi:hypothetical protein